MEVKHLENVEIPDEIKKLLFTAFKFDVPQSGAITFEIMFEAGVLPDELPDPRQRKQRGSKVAGQPLNFCGELYSGSGHLPEYSHICIPHWFLHSRQERYAYRSHRPQPESLASPRRFHNGRIKKDLHCGGFIRRYKREKPVISDWLVDTSMGIRT